MEKAAYLISGGIDSPVAAYLGIRRGWKPVFIYFDNSPFADEETKQKAIKTIKQVINVTKENGELLIVPHGMDLQTIVKKCKSNLRCLLCKRMMYRKASIIAEKYGCDAVVTGEILGEQASQTMRNLVIDSAIVDIPILRPLIGMNKLEVTDLAQRIGTLEYSMIKTKPCGAAAIKARTRAKAVEVEREEAKMPIDAFISKALDGITRCDVC